MIILPLENGLRSSFSDKDDVQFIFKRWNEALKEGAEFMADQQTHVALVERAVEAMKAGEMEKVVLSRIKSVRRTKGSDEELFRRIVDQYPSACCFQITTSSGEKWMGASPEVLLKKRGDRFYTHSLAGTQALKPELTLSEYQWGEKEQHEQQVVTDFILHLLKSQDCADIQTEGPNTVQAGQLVHLRTDISFSSQKSAEALAALLHPTPAVAGFPRDKAIHWIHAFEPHYRGYYTGYIGVICPNGDADFYVNLRCMRVTPEAFYIYVGGGITKQSNAMAEWEETENKAGTMLRIIESVQHS